jgi:hypothetical protein
MAIPLPYHLCVPSGSRGPQNGPIHKLVVCNLIRIDLEPHRSGSNFLISPFLSPLILKIYL